MGLFTETDVLVIGAGASGLMCAAEAGKRGRRVKVLEHANKPGKKILMSGGGRCNFTNYSVSSDNYLSNNPHFCKSALSRYSQWDFLALVAHYAIPYHEREHGQLFCDRSAKDILTMLLTECAEAQVNIRLNTVIENIEKKLGFFAVKTSQGEFRSEALVVATGGLSIPKMGASPLGYKIAAQFDIPVIPTRAGLVPLTLHADDKEHFAPLSGIAVPCVIGVAEREFRENLLFTHRGLSGPAVLQISSYWRPGEVITVNLMPDTDLVTELKALRQQQYKKTVKSVLESYLPKRLLTSVLMESELNQSLQDSSDRQFEAIAGQLQYWQIKPNGTEGYRTAEVTVGGVDCDAISSKTMESRQVPGLYFVGEVLDVTGWLGGYNFQWAWSSGWCAGQNV